MNEEVTRAPDSSVNRRMDHSLDCTPKVLSKSDVEAGVGIDSKNEKTVTFAAADKLQPQHSAMSQLMWLTVWMANNIGITLLNKSVFKSVNFNCPYALSAVHMLCNTIGALVYAWAVPSTPVKKLGWSHQKVVIGFSFLFAANIAVGNDSLRHVSVSFNQVMRSLVPGVVMGMGLATGKQFSRAKKLAVVPVVGGIALATLGEIRFTVLGFFITVLCVVLAALKVVVSGMALTGDMKLHPIDLLIKMAPLAFGECLFMSYCQGEIAEIISLWQTLVETKAIHLVLLTGVLSFSLNILSFTANKVTSPLTLTVSANLKQALLIILGPIVFGTPISSLGVVGTICVIIGSGRYSYVGYTEQQQQQKEQAQRLQ